MCLSKKNIYLFFPTKLLVKVHFTFFFCVCLLLWNYSEYYSEYRSGKQCKTFVCLMLSSMWSISNHCRVTVTPSHSLQQKRSTVYHQYSLKLTSFTLDHMFLYSFLPTYTVRDNIVGCVNETNISKSWNATKR